MLAFKSALKSEKSNFTAKPKHQIMYSSEDLELFR